jgi:hypothetical protein
VDAFTRSSSVVMLKNDALVGEKKNSAGIAKESENCQGRGLDICTWLEQLKGGYSKFTPSFEEMGIGDEEDLTELHAEDIMALEQAIIEKGAEPIHLRVIRRAIDSLRNSTFTNVELATNTTGSPLSPKTSRPSTFSSPLIGTANWQILVWHLGLVHSHLQAERAGVAQ